jgi:O-antigen/teichoic acid export membrane protein
VINKELKDVTVAHPHKKGDQVRSVHDQRAGLTDGPTLARNSVWNLLGQTLPLLVGVAATPVLIHRLGTDKFGVLALAWIVVGYFTLFDFGLGRALTKLIAQKLGDGSKTDIPVLFWTALFLMGGVGVVGGVFMAVLTPWLTTHVLSIPRTIVPETTQAFFLLSIGLPIVIITAGLQGVLAAYQQFTSFAAVRVVTGVWSFVGPWLSLVLTNNLAAIAAVLVVGRAVACVLSAWLCFRVDPRLRHASWVREAVKPLVSFGSWMTVTNVVGPLMMYLDRFVIGVVLSMTAVAYYATPYDVVTRLLIIPTSLLGVLFPAFSTSLAVDRMRAGRLFERAVGVLFLLMFPITLVIVGFAYDGLNLWLGSEFAHHSAPVLQWIAFGVFINSFGMVPFGSIQADGRPDITAKLHLIELPIYFGILWFLLKKWGIEGAAIAWFLRLVLDDAVLYWVALRDLPEARAGVIRKGSFILFSCIVVLAFIWSPPSSLLLRVGVISACLVTFFGVFWHTFLDANEKVWFRSYARARNWEHNA